MTLTAFLGVGQDDQGLFHIVSFPEDYDPAGAVASVELTLSAYPEPYNTPTWVASTGPDPLSITQTLAEHYAVPIVSAPVTAEPVTAEGPPGGILAALEQRDQGQA